MPIPRYKDIDLALLLELVRAGRAVRPTDTYEAVAQHFPDLSETDKALTRKDGRTKAYQNAVHWARDHLRVRGLLLDRSGLWEVNGLAIEALKEDLVSRGLSRPSIDDFVSSRRSIGEVLGRSWATPVRPRAGSQSPNSPLIAIRPSQEQLSSTSGYDVGEQRPFSNATEVRQSVIARLEAMDGYEFEQLVARVLDGAGLRNSRVVGRSGDEGVDIMAELASPFVTAVVAVQVKRHSANVGPKDVSYLRDRWTRRADKLLLVTTSDFTVGAKEVAEDPERPVTLVNGARLVDIMLDFGLGVKQQPVITFALDEEFFSV